MKVKIFVRSQIVGVLEKLKRLERLMMNQAKCTFIEGSLAEGIEDIPTGSC